MKKIVINNCFGGFSLSPIGEREYLKLKGKQAHFYKQTKYSFKDGANLYEKFEPSVDEREMFCHTLTKDMGKSFSEFPKEDEVYFSGREIERDDTDLIKVVETLGDKANGACAELKIVEIPDDADWEISEYDGNEHIAEKHRTWY